MFQQYLIESCFTTMSFMEAPIRFRWVKSPHRFISIQWNRNRLELRKDSRKRVYFTVFFLGLFIMVWNQRTDRQSPKSGRLVQTPCTCLQTGGKVDFNKERARLEIVLSTALVKNESQEVCLVDLKSCLTTCVKIRPNSVSKAAISCSRRRLMPV